MTRYTIRIRRAILAAVLTGVAFVGILAMVTLFPATYEARALHALPGLSPTTTITVRPIPVALPVAVEPRFTG